jgi:hypothetical protein
MDGTPHRVFSGRIEIAHGPVNHMHPVPQLAEQVR